MTAAQLQLITAAVDGELSATEQRALRVLLTSDPSAQELFTKLKSDRARLRALPQATPPADLQARILARIAAATTAPAVKAKVKPKPLAEPARKSATPTPARHRAWVPAAVAAGVLLCVTLGSFAFFRDNGANNQIVKNSWADVLPSVQSTPQELPSPGQVPFERPDPSKVARADVSPVPPVPNPREVPPATVVTAPAPRTVNPDLIGFGLLPKLPPFERIEVKVPFLRPVADLGREDVSAELLDAIARDAGVTPTRFDLFVRDTARGVDLFQNAAKVTGVQVFADAATLDKLKKKQVHAAVIYTEALSAKELVTLFAALAVEDAKFSPRVGDLLHPTAIVRADELELKAVLGQDVGLYKRPVGNGQSGGGPDRVSPGKSVNADTIDRVVQSVTGAPVAKTPEKTAILMTWQTTHPSVPRTNPVASAELKQFVQKRGDRKPNAVPAIVVIRPAG